MMDHKNVLLSSIAAIILACIAFASSDGGIQAFVYILTCIFLIGVLLSISGTLDREE